MFKGLGQKLRGPTAEGSPPLRLGKPPPPNAAWPKIPPAAKITFRNHVIFEPRFFITFSQILLHFWIPFSEFFHVFCITFSRIDFAQMFHWFSIDFGMDFSLIFHHLCIQTSLRYQTPRTWFLNNSIVFCAQNKVLTLSEKLFFHDCHAFLYYNFLHWFLMSFGIDFCSIWGAFWHHFLYFFVADFSMNLRLYFLWILDQNGSTKTTPGGSKNSIPLVGFWFASCLATLVLKGVLQNLILVTRALKRVLQNAILDVVSCIFFPNLFAGRQHRGDTENMDKHSSSQGPKAQR